jgi:alanyl-tRNA synthetase
MPPLPAADTLVTYPDGEVTGYATVVHAEPVAGGRTAVLLDRTPAHPVDTAWPDQPADRGSLRGDGGAVVPLVGIVTGGIRDGVLFVGADLPVRTGTEGWTFVVAHLIEAPAPEVGADVRVDVDAGYRRALSIGHTACHIASLALDDALRDAWTKDPPRDALGHPAFDSLAIETSAIEPFGSVDRYRIGKSLRRKGFDPGALDDLDALAERVTSTLRRWVEAGSSVAIERDEDGLSARRRWVCDLPDGRVSIPCGGTHISSLRELDDVSVSFALAPVDGGLALTMTTSARAANADD